MGSRGSVLVAMSGGVDSSVSACLLAEQGYEVVGSHMKLVHLTGGGVDHGCCGPNARVDAERVAGAMGFPFEVHDVSEEFEETVIADFFAEHAAGRTPNPCVRCNEHIKFRAFLRRADELGCDFVATGHYVRTARGDDGVWHMYKARDAAKDQSYVLHVLTQEALARSLFPVAAMTKAEVRANARRFGLLEMAAKPDSQEVCFVPGADHAAFIEEFLPRLVRSGELVDPAGNVVGTHDGSFRFTVGQRRGLGISTGEPNYVLGVDAIANRVVVGPSEMLRRRGLLADRVTWIAEKAPPGSRFSVSARIRYRGDEVPAVVEETGPGLVRVVFASSQRAVAPGQSVAFYDGDEVLGGGRILEAIR